MSTHEPPVPRRVHRVLSLTALLSLSAVAACGQGAPSPRSAWTSPAGEPGPSATATRAPTATAAATPRATAGSTAAPTRAAPDWRYVFPVPGGNVSYHPTHAAYPATDIFADCGVPVVAVTDGRVLEISRVDRYRKTGPDGPLNGGRFVSILGDDGVRYYGSHLTEVALGIEAGVRVRAGQRLGTVGRTGNANNVCHLHFAISPPCARTGDWWIRRGVVWPAPFLDSWRKKSARSPVAKVTAWHRDRGCPKAP
ncbi:Murein DD-endopeptidase MepM and murein hydrolase activator NlpD, contain LysM domain [Micromonospora pattaloongensis]|uniref:Murein DD-endopeptidase MepM and murein hydrolase activator NlpD, contain LysM domain n=1 Tax=Micromonospora pattaloongensis TaxID=405436 RepID=A0A1H3HGK6_9ACTN|nr:M23 family metallopeptidase [Micromonospora pattaloongensis]SDY14355.1 Murein DD-endopeptidase MepM and murein hydrolase activator NlpD, contain LysM domain [Micromonospora pattaloongensis]